jgi:hypothetical protein
MSWYGFHGQGGVAESLEKEDARRPCYCDDDDDEYTIINPVKARVRPNFER